MRWTKVVALAAAGSLSLAACSSGGSSSSNSSDDSDSFESVPASAALQPDAKGPAPAVKGAKSGGTLYVKSANVPENTDPSTQYFTDTNTIHQLTTRRLTQYKQVGKNKSVLVPDMATDLGKKSKDGLTWSFTLKKGLKYEDGTPIKASDIKYSVERSFDTAMWPSGPTYQIDYFKGGDKYKGPYKSGNLDSIKVDDKKGTISFEMARKFETFPYFASFSMFGGIPKSKDTKSNYQLKWLSSGPYKIKSYSKGSSLTLVKNKQWDAKSDPSRHQYPDTIQFSFGGDAATTAKAIMASNSTDASTISYDGVDPAVLTQAIGAKKNQVVSGPSPCTRWPGATMDTQKIPLDVRKAIATAWPIDQVRIARGFNKFNAVSGSTISAPQVPGFKKYALPGLEGKGQGDAAKAKQMLQKAGKTGFTLSYYYVNDQPDTKKAQSVLQPALERAGFKVKPIGVTSADYRNKIKNPKAPTNMGNGVATGWCYDWPAGDAIYPPLFNSSLQSNSGVGNVKNAELDRLMRTAAAKPATEQGAAWSSIDKKVLKDILPVVPMFYDRGTSIFGTKVKNALNDPNLGMPVLADVYVQQ